MALFLANHPIEKIKILGRWRSDAFLSYIRPQVLEWTNLMAKDMSDGKGFLDLAQDQQIQPDRPSLAAKGPTAKQDSPTQRKKWPKR